MHRLGQLNVVARGRANRAADAAAAAGRRRAASAHAVLTSAGEHNHSQQHEQQPRALSRALGHPRRYYGESAASTRHASPDARYFSAAATGPAGPGGPTGAAVGRNQELHDAWRRSSAGSGGSTGVNLGAIDLHSGFGIDFDEWITERPSSPSHPVSPSRVSHRVQTGVSPTRRTHLHRGMPEIVRGALPGSLDDILSAYQHHHDDHAGAFHCAPDYDDDAPLEYLLQQHDYNEYPNVEHNPSSVSPDEFIVINDPQHRPASPAVDYSLPGTADRSHDVSGRGLRQEVRRPVQQRMRSTQPRRMRYHLQDNVRGVMFTPSTREKQQHHIQQPVIRQPAARSSAAATAKRAVSPAAATGHTGYRTIRRVHARSAAAPATAGRAPSLLSVHNRRTGGARFRGLRALFVRVSTRVRAVLRAVATADSATPTAGGDKQPTAATAAEHAHHTINRRHVRHSLHPTATIGRGTTMRPRVQAAVRPGLRRRTSGAATAAAHVNHTPPAVPAHGGPTAAAKDGGRSGRIPRATVRRRA